MDALAGKPLASSTHNPSESRRKSLARRRAAKAVGSSRSSVRKRGSVPAAPLVPEPHETHSIPGHGARILPAVQVDAYNAEIRDADGFIGDRASRRAFHAILEKWRATLRSEGVDPLGKHPTAELNRGKLDKLLVSGDAAVAALLHSAIEEFAGELASVTRRFLQIKSWHKTEHIVVGGGMRDSRIGQLAIARAAIMLRAGGLHLALTPIRHHPDEAGLIGAVQLVPAWVFAGYDAILAADIGGTNFRVGVVEFNRSKAGDLRAAKVWESLQWRHANEKPGRDKAMRRLIEMFRELIRRARKRKLVLAPLIGIGCPGIVRKDGSILRGGQNLPGNWESDRFNPPAVIGKAIPKIGREHTVVLMHNDAVVQGLSEAPFMRDAKRWGVLTIGTGLGNARFTNRT